MITMRRLLLIGLLALGLMGPGVGVGYAAVLATDDFNRADGTLGANWTTIAGFANPAIVTNQVQPNAVGGTGSLSLYTGTTFPNDQYAKTSIIAALTANTRNPGLLLRGTTAARTEYECVLFGPLGATVQLKINRYNAGVLASLATTGADQTVVTTDVMKCTVVGYVLTIYINDVSKLVYDDSASGSKITSGTPGIHLYTAAGLTSNVQIDNFEAGDMSVTSSNGTLNGWMEVDE